MNKNNNPLVTVGIPVFNGEKFMKRRLDSILNQTYQNFQILISDNESSDLTSKICGDYQKKENKIKYYRQQKNLGFVKNFNYLIKNTQTKYFVMAAVDDLWEPTFLEENIKILESNEKIVGSIGEVNYFGNISNKNNPPKIVEKLKKIIRKQDVNTLEKHVRSVSGEYNQKVDKYLRFNQGSFVHGLYRTKELQKNIILGPLMSWDLAFILNILKFGDLHVIEQVLLHKFTGGLSSGGIINIYKRHEIPFYDLIIPSFSLFKWCWKNVGINFCLRNLDWFIVLIIYGWYNIKKDII
jgi:glycosyltransferase involved in cell wall biosynthesis